MNKTVIAICLLALVSFSSCKKDEFNFLTQSHPSVPVTVSNLYTMNSGVPAVQTSLSGGGAVSIILEIPASSGRTIKEITRIGTSTTATAGYGTVQTTNGLYN